MTGKFARNNRELPENRSMKVRIQMLKMPSISGSLF
jgi:hypothetical protein